MTGTVTKGKALREDLDLYDGLSLAGSRADSSGGTFSGLRVGDDVDVLSVYGGGSARTVSTISAATAALGSANVGLRFAPGTWVIDSDVTLAANFTAIVPAGCVFAVSSGATLTFNGALIRYHGTYTSGSGTVVVNGADTLASQDIYADYAADTGSADVYVIAPSPAIGAYAAGQRFRFKAGNTNTGAATLNVNSLGARTIKKERTTDLAAGDIVADDIITVHYDGTNFQIQPTIAIIESSTDHMEDVFTTRGDLVRAGAAGVAERFGFSTEGEVPRFDGTDVVARRYFLESGELALSGGSTDFASVPTWAKAIDISIASAQNGASTPVIQLGSSGTPLTTGYLGTVSQGGATFASSANSIGLALRQSSPLAGDIIHGNVRCTLQDSTNNVWLMSANIGFSNGAVTLLSNAEIALSGALDIIRFNGNTTSWSGGAFNVQVWG